MARHVGQSVDWLVILQCYYRSTCIYNFLIVVSGEWWCAHVQREAGWQQQREALHNLRPCRSECLVAVLDIYILS